MAQLSIAKTFLLNLRPNKGSPHYNRFKKVVFLAKHQMKTFLRPSLEVANKNGFKTIMTHKLGCPGCPSFWVIFHTYFLSVRKMALFIAVFLSFYFSEIKTIFGLPF